VDKNKGIEQRNAMLKNMRVIVNHPGLLTETILYKMKKLLTKNHTVKRVIFTITATLNKDINNHTSFNDIPSHSLSADEYLHSRCRKPIQYPRG